MKKIPVTAGTSGSSGPAVSTGNGDTSTTGDRSKERVPQTAARK